MSNTTSANAGSMTKAPSVPQAIDKLHRTNGLVELMYLASEHLDDSHMAHAFTTTCHLIGGMLNDAIAELHDVEKGGAK